MAEEPTLERAMVLLSLLYRELHPFYGNTSYRGRGIGGSAVTQQCCVTHPEGWEVDVIQKIEEILHTYAEGDPKFPATCAAYIKQVKDG